MARWRLMVIVTGILFFYGLHTEGIAQDQRASIAVNQVEELSKSSLPGFIKVRYQKPGVYWRDYFLHVPVSAIEQVNVEPRVTKLYFKSLKLPDIADEGPVELVISKKVRSSSELFRLMRQVLLSRNDSTEKIIRGVRIHSDR